MTEPVMSLGEWNNNGEMLADVARLGYLDGRVLDCTYGEGAFWTVFRPKKLVACDLDPAKSPVGYSVDFRNLPWRARSFDSVVIDGPYKLTGTPSTPDMDSRYGTTKYVGWRERHALIREGMTECERVLRPKGYLLVKCQDQVCGGKVRWQTREFADHGESLGLRLRSSFLLRSYREQDPKRGQQHERRNFSTLLVFVKPPARRAVKRSAAS
jgi:hypothetical protein